MRKRLFEMKINYEYLRAEIDFPEKNEDKRTEKKHHNIASQISSIKKNNWCQLQLSVVERKFFVLCIGSKYMHLPHKP